MWAACWRSLFAALLMFQGAFGWTAELAYPPVVPGIRLVFPEDTGAHPAFRTEWWYVTGWLADEEGVERGFQVTFFRVRTGVGEDNPSRFAPRQLVLAHAALADPQQGRLLHDERAARALAPLAGFETERTHAWIGDWWLRLEQTGYRTQVKAADFAFELRFVPQAPPLINGEGGFSRKAADPKHASYYYSRPQLAVDGTLRVRTATHRVRGLAWLDHEWSSELMPPGARGWDWIGINLHDGGALMAFRMRDEAEQPLWAGGSLRGADGVQVNLGAQQVRWIPGRRWRSPRTGADYPVEWTVEIDPPSGAAPRRLKVVPWMDDQELDSRRSTGAVYWEGAVRLLEEDREIGRGYLEMTGYAERLRM